VSFVDREGRVPLETMFRRPAGNMADEWVIGPDVPTLMSRARDVWRYRHLVGYTGQRALEKMYTRTVLGRLWLFIRPLVEVMAGTIVFGNIIGVESENVPYFLFFLIGMTIWNLFSSSLMWITRSLEMNYTLLKHCYFPRVILPIGSAAPAWTNFAIYTSVIVVTVSYYYRTEQRMYLVVGFETLLAIAMIVLTAMFALAIGLWTSVLGANARDVRFALGYGSQFWFYLTPVIYPVSAIPERWRWLAKVNPMAPVVETFKWSTLGIGHLDVRALLLSIAVILLLLSGGFWFFNRSDPAAFDRI
jgi:lipopolysaccharide transport system permease protein